MKYKKLYCALVIIGFICILIMWTQLSSTKPHEKDPFIKYILQWTSPKTEPFAFMGQGQSTFIKNNCSINNCFITADRSYFYEITEFDVVLFHGPELYPYKNKIMKMPKKRSPNQSYIFASMESPVYYPVDDQSNGVFNNTWTYKLNSDIYYGYMIIRDENGEVIGPQANIDWIDAIDMLPINDTVKNKLVEKKLAAAWFVSNCKAPSKRNELASQISLELNKYGLNLDIYGKCGTKECPRNSMKECLEMVQRDYYFYFAFENSFAEDYVTEKLLHALQNYAIPVVYGGANYTRFMPDGIYLNARTLTVEDLTKQMVEIISDTDKYYNYFKWHNHYSYHSVQETSDTDYYCNLCEFINKKEFNNESSVWTNFATWWNETS